MALCATIFISIIITSNVGCMDEHQHIDSTIIKNLSEMLTHITFDARDLFRKRWHKGRNFTAERQRKYYKFKQDLLQSRLAKLVTLFDLCLKEVPYLISSWLFSSFIDALVMGTYPFETHSLMEIDLYYIKARQASIPLDIITFNILLKAVRKTHPVICGGLAAAYLKEMHQLQIVPDAFTINELLCMAARHPNATSYDREHSNKWVADQEYKYYLKHIMGQFDSQCSPVFILNSYMNVYAQDGDITGMRHALRIARDGGMKLERPTSRREDRALSSVHGPLHTTIQKCWMNWLKKRIRFCNWKKSGVVCIYDYL